jgi:hypothetical protein
LNGQHRGRLWEDRLSELADYRKSTGTAMFLKYSETPSWLNGSNPATVQAFNVRKKDIIHDALRIQALA